MHRLSYNYNWRRWRSRKGLCVWDKKLLALLLFRSPEQQTQCKQPGSCHAGLLIDTMTSKSKKPLPLSDILRDLALLRGHDIPELFKAAQQSSSSDVTPSPNSSDLTAASYSYIATVRAALKLNNSGQLKAEGRRIEDIRNKYEELGYLIA